MELSLEKDVKFYNVYKKLKLPALEIVAQKREITRVMRDEKEKYICKNGMLLKASARHPEL